MCWGSFVLGLAVAFPVVAVVALILWMALLARAVRGSLPSE